MVFIKNLVLMKSIVARWFFLPILYHFVNMLVILLFRILIGCLMILWLSSMNQIAWFRMFRTYLQSGKRFFLPIWLTRMSRCICQFFPLKVTHVHLYSVFQLDWRILGTLFYCDFIIIRCPFIWLEKNTLSQN